MRRLIGDIGGTNARFALVDPSGLPAEVRILRTADHAGLVEAALAYLEGREPVDEAVIAVATPVDTEVIRFTNNPWSFRVDEVRQRLGLHRLDVINDFVAQAEAMPHLLPADLERIGGGTPMPGRAIGVIGAGTGLGVSALVPTPEGLLALATEGGHASLAPGTPREIALLGQLAAKFGHVSKERVLSGPGLLHAAKGIAALDGAEIAARTPEDVATAARNGSCAFCREAVATFSGLLGSAAADLALTYGAKGGIYLAGGLCLSLGDLFDRAVFRRRFEEKGRMRGFVEPIPVYLVTRADTGLLGTARHRLA